MFNTAATDPPVEKLWILYDSSCGFCVSCRRWLERQPAWVPLEFLPAGSEAAAVDFPGLEGTRDELAVVASNGDVYRGDSAWLTCLWALRDYRGLAERLSGSALLPYARQAFELVARNRKTLSTALGLLPEAELREELEHVSPSCAKPPLPFYGVPDRGGSATKVVLGLVIAILLYVLVGSFHDGIASWLLGRGIVRNASSLRVIGFDSDEALRQAAAAGDTDRVRALLRAGVDPNRRDRSDESPLWRAAIGGHAESVRALLDGGNRQGAADRRLRASRHRNGPRAPRPRCQSERPRRRGPFRARSRPARRRHPRRRRAHRRRRRSGDRQPSERQEVSMLLVQTYLAYLVISIGLTIWVARTLHKNGRVFLVDSFLGNRELADSVNHLLVVGFYLINIGFVAFALKENARPKDTAEGIEVLSTKVGLVLLVLGVMHFFNLYVFTRLRKRALLRHMPPPVAPQERIAVRVPQPAPPPPPAAPPAASPAR